MSFAGLFDGTACSAMQFSLALQSDLVEGGDGVHLPVSSTVAGDENESRSGCEHLDAGEGEESDFGENPRKRKKRYHRHTPQQIQELESLFKECPHPDDKQRLELSKRLSLDPRQVKFWFQNRRTQMKMQMERHENAMLKQENEKLRAENLSLREAIRSPTCGSCGGPAAMLAHNLSLEEQHLRVENARLRDELTRVCALAAKFIGKPNAMASSMPLLPVPPSSSLELAVGCGNTNTNLIMSMTMMPAVSDFAGCVSSPMETVISPVKMVGLQGTERTLLLELASRAMDELVRLASTDEPLWIPAVEGDSGKQTLFYEEYLRVFPSCIGEKPDGFVSEVSRETGVVIIDNSLALVETLMDATRWSDMFSCMIARAATTEVLSIGVGGTRNGALQLMQAEMQVLSPLVPIREVTFLRFCKQLDEGSWAVVDVSIDAIRDNHPSAVPGNMKCRRLPSGCVVQDTPNGYCKVTWVEHAEYDEKMVHQLYRPLLRSGLALGARRWLSTLQRQCECLAILMSNAAPPTHNDITAITAVGRRSMLKLAQRMTENFCAGVSTSSARKWSKLVGAGGIGEDVHVMPRQSVDVPGEPPGVVLSAATSVWVPVSPNQLFDFLRDERLRAEWDILSNGGPMQEMAHIAKGQHHGNSVSLLKASAVSANQSSMLILQETCTDASGSMIVYAPVDIPAMQLVVNGGDSTYVALLPSGFAILPDGPSIGTGHKIGGSLLTVAFQILVNSQPTAKLTIESVETVNNLISCTIRRIKSALHCDA